MRQIGKLVELLARLDCSKRSRVKKVQQVSG